MSTPTHTRRRPLRTITKVKLSITVDQDTLRRVEKIAKSESRSLSSTVSVLLERGLLYGPLVVRARARAK